MAFTVNAFIGGRARSAIGDEGCVESNTADTLNLIEPELLATVTSLVADTSITVTKHIYFVPGVVLELTHPTTPANSVMVEVAAVTEVSATESRLDIVPGYAFGSDFVGAGVSVAQNFLRPEVVYGSAASPLHFSAPYFVGAEVFQDVHVPGAQWVGSQWKGYVVCFGGDFDGETGLAIVDNTTDTLKLRMNSALSTTDDLIIAIAHDYTVAIPFASRVPIWRLTALARGLTTLLEPTLDYERKGTPWYGHNHLVGNDAASPIGGAWTPLDVGIKVTTPGLVDVRAKSVSLSPDGLTLTMAVPTPMVPGSHVGKFLNPNQNQVTLFKVVSNTSTTVTVDAPMDGVFSVGEVAYVIGPRVAVKYERALAQMKKFANPDVRLHILFD